MPKLKTPADVSQLVDELIKASPEVMAIGDDTYCVIDLNDEHAETLIDEILREFGPRDHLHLEIVACLKDRGRFLDLPRHEYLTMKLATVH